MKIFSSVVAALLGAFMSIGVAQASPISTSIGNVSILGSEYAVSLLSDTSYDLQTISNLSPSLTFTTQSDATAAANALLSTFGAGYLWNPTCTGCAQGVRVLFDLGSSTYSYLTVYGGAVNGPYTLSIFDGNNFSVAQFAALAPSAVPLPASLFMMLGGIGALSFVTRRKKAA